MHAAASGTSAHGLGLILMNFMQGQHDSSAACSSVALQGAHVLLLRSSVPVSGEPGIPMELIYTLAASSASPAAPRRSAGSTSSSPHLSWAPANAVLLDFLVHTASHEAAQRCVQHLSREFHLHMLCERQNPCAVAHSSSLTYTSAHLERLFLKLLSKTVKLKLSQFRSAGLHC